MYSSKIPFQASLLALSIALTGCGGDSSSSSSSGVGSAPEVPFNISAIGGNSEARTAGNGGSVYIKKSLSEAPLVLRADKTATGKYELPETTIQLGTQPAVVNTDTTVETLANLPANAAVGLLYMVSDEPYLYQYDGSGKLGSRAQVISGLSIAAGITLKLEANSSNTTELFFTHDIENNGAIETVYAAAEEDARTTRVGLELTVAAYHGNGSLNTSGQYKGQNAGEITVSAFTIDNSGDISANGADAITGDAVSPMAAGNSGFIELNSLVYIANEGNVSATSGSADKSAAGRTNDVDFSSNTIINHGDINISSGSGASASFNNSAILLNARNTLINTGDLTANGATLVEADFDTSAPNAGNIQLMLGMGGIDAGTKSTFINSGDLSANGGNHEGFSAALSSTTVAGDGGEIELTIVEGNDEGASFNIPVVVAISGNLSVNGGHATSAYYNTYEGFSGGDAGYIRISHSSMIDSKNPTQIAGYETINVSGGHGVAGGDAGYVTIYTEDSDDAANSPLPAAPIEAHINILAQGGTGKASENSSSTLSSVGGEGGAVNIAVVTARPYLQPKKLTLNIEGDINISSGNSVDATTRSANVIELRAPANIDAKGNFTFNGGSDTDLAADDSEGSDAGVLALTSLFGSVNLDATAEGNGGNAIAEGGDGGLIYASGQAGNTLKGTYSLNGGSTQTSKTDNTDSVGGNGGLVLATNTTNKSKVKAQVTSLAGSGDDAGFEGGVFVNSVCTQGTCNSY